MRKAAEKRPAAEAVVVVNGAATDTAFDQFFELSIDMLCIAGFDGHFKSLNKVWEQVTGFSVEELIRRPYLDFVHPDDVERTNDEVAKQHDLGLEVFSFEPHRVLSG